MANHITSIVNSDLFTTFHGELALLEDVSLAADFDGGPGDDPLDGTPGPDSIRGLDGDDTINGFAGNDTLSGGLGSDELNGAAGLDTMSGDEGGDLLNGGINDDNLNGGAGDDVLRGGDGDDIVIGDLISNTGDDLLFGENGADFVDGGNGNDVVSGGAGQDTLVGGAGDDEISGGAHDDTLNSGGSGRDILRGGLGDDTLFYDTGGIAILMDGGDGNDIVTVKQNRTIVGNQLKGGAGIDLLELGGSHGIGAALFSAASTGFERLTIVNSLFADDTSNRLDFSGFDILSGAISIFGKGGEDRLTGNVGADTLRGEEGNDVLVGLAGNDTLTGSNGDDRLDGGAGNDDLRGGPGVDTLRGGAGDDILRYGDGSGVDPLLDGGSGNDTVIVNANFAVVGGQLKGGTGDDLLDLGGNNTFFVASFSARASGFERVDGASFSGDDNANNLDFSQVTVTSGFLRIAGKLGNDTLTTSGADDSLFGDAGDDVLDGGGGNDSLDGGSGLDTASYVTAAGGVTVAIIAGVQVTGGAGNDTLNLIENLLGSRFNDSLTGDGSANALTGGLGRDALLGGGGNDILRGGLGRDLHTGGGDADAFVFATVAESGVSVAQRDQLLDFNHAEEDQIDLSAIDAVTGGADDSFSLVAAFTGVAGQLISKLGPGLRHIVGGDVDGNGSADFSIVVFSTTLLVTDDFIL